MSWIFCLLTFFVIGAEVTGRHFQKRDEFSEIQEAVADYVLTQQNKPYSFNFLRPVVPFIGRTAELTELFWMLKDNQVTVITGNRGVGKTELARKFALDQKVDNESSVVFMDASTNLQLARDFKELALVCGMRTEGKSSLSIIQEAVERLKGRKTLLVMDNSGSDNDILKTIVPRVGKSNLQLLITSRDDNWDKEFYKIHLREFSTEEAVDYLKEALLPKVPFHIPEEEIYSLLAMVGHLPINLRQLVTTFEGDLRVYPQKNLEDFLHDLRNKGKVVVAPSIKDTDIEELISKKIEDEAFENKVKDKAGEGWRIVKDGTVKGYHHVAKFSEDTWVEELKPAAEKVADVAKSVASKISDFFG